MIIERRRDRSYRTIVEENGTYTVEIVEGIDVVERVPFFLDKMTAETWIAAERRWSQDEDLTP